MRKSKIPKQNETITSIRKSYRNCSFNPLRSIRDSTNLSKTIKTPKKITDNKNHYKTFDSSTIKKRRTQPNFKKPPKINSEKNPLKNSICQNLRNSAGPFREKNQLKNKRFGSKEKVLKKEKRVVGKSFLSYRHLLKEKKTKEKKKLKRRKKMIKNRSRTLSSYWPLQGSKDRNLQDSEKVTTSQVKNEKKIKAFMKNLRKSYKEKLSSLTTFDSGVRIKKKCVGKNLSTEESLSKNLEKNKNKEKTLEKRNNSQRKNIVLTSLQQVLSRETSVNLQKKKNRKHCKPKLITF